MENNGEKRILSFAGIARFLIPLAMGLAIGAFLYSRFTETDSSRFFPTVPEDRHGPAEIAADTVQISPEAQKEVGIGVESAAFRDLEDTLSATGTVSEDPGRVAHIRPLARGLIERSYVGLGDRVSAGEPLVEYDNIELGMAIGEYRTAQAELLRSLTDLEVRKTILDRGKEMLRAGAIARTAYDLREAEYKDAEAKAAGTRATAEKIEEQIHRFGWTDRDLANLLAKKSTVHTITHSILKAPFPGIVTAFHASIGEFVEPTTELLTITDMSSLWVLADVFEKDLAHVRSGKPVQVQVTSYPGRAFHGKITYVADAIEPKTRTAKVRCLVENNSGLLKLGMFASVEIPVGRTNSVLAVPDSSIQQIEGKTVVFVRKSETGFQKREVRTGIASGGFTEILSGLAAGDLVTNEGSFVVKTEFLRNQIGEDE